MRGIPSPAAQRGPGVHATGRTRRHRRWLRLPLLLFLGVLAAASSAQSPQREALLLTLADAVTPATMDYLQRGIARAEAVDAGLVIVEVDTPGGLMASTHELIKTILASRVPIATFVSPPGSRAASAGTYILLASHIAAMAPATHIGSATPVQMGGLPGLPSDGAPADSEDPAAGPGNDGSIGSSAQRMDRKVMEDAVSYIRELAERHGRNADWAERAVREAANLGAREALEENVIDLIATDIDDLLRQLNGMTVTLGSSDHVLDTSAMSVTRIDPDWRTRLLSVISNPSVAYFLLLIGFYGIIFEFSNPGSLFPGVIGATCLLVALFAFQILSVNYAGLALILLGLAFIVAEAFIPSFGVLGIGGLIAFVAGSIILMDGSNQSVSLPLIGGLGAVAAGFLLWAVSRLVALRGRTPVYGVEQQQCEVAVAAENFTQLDGRYRGHVTMNGERWKAISDTPVQSGDRLRVLALDGLTVKVASPDPAAAPATH